MYTDLLGALLNVTFVDCKCCTFLPLRHLPVDPSIIGEWF